MEQISALGYGCKFNKTECPKQSSVHNVGSVRIPVTFHGSRGAAFWDISGGGRRIF